MAENKQLIHQSFYIFLLSSITFSSVDSNYLHTIYDAHPTFSLALPYALTSGFWYLLPFSHNPPHFEYSAKDYSTWVMHFLAHSVDDTALNLIISNYTSLEHLLLSPYIHPAPLTSPSHITGQIHVQTNMYHLIFIQVTSQ
jgi:hypothetical protein